MFGDSRAFGSSAVSSGHSARGDEGAATPIRKASPDRLAELVYHLGDVPLVEARRAVRRTGQAGDSHDPLSIVAAALVQLRRDADRHRYIGA